MALKWQKHQLLFEYVINFYESFVFLVDTGSLLIYSLVFFSFLLSLSFWCHPSFSTFILTFSHWLSCQKSNLFLWSRCFIIQHTAGTHRHGRSSNCRPCQSSWTFTRVSFNNLNSLLLFGAHVKLLFLVFSVQWRLSECLFLSFVHPSALSSFSFTHLLSTLDTRTD